MSITVLIAEDDPAMRRVLRKVAEENGDVRVVGEAADGMDALALFKTLRPQVVFVDIDLPGKNGVTLAREIFAIDPRIQFVFITAFDQYREEAFDVYACDYLVKPFKIQRLRQTLDRLRSLLSSQATDQASPGMSHLPDIPAGALYMFRTGTTTTVLPIKDIVFISREGRKTVVYHTGGRLETGENLSTLAAELGGYPFLRTHKGFVVNLQMVREILPAGRNTFEIVMANVEDKRPLLTREKYREMEQALKGNRPR